MQKAVYRAGSVVFHQQTGQFAWSLQLLHGHQRLHARYLSFAHWLIGLTDGDGCFSISKSNDKFTLNWSISQSVYNIRLLAYVKSNMGIGSISQSKDGAVYRVRNVKHLNTIVFPLFAIYPLLTFKQFHAKRVRLASITMMNEGLSKQQKQDCLDLLKCAQAPLQERTQACTMVLHDSWLIGFMEAEASFFIQKKDTRFVCCFAITQKRDKPLLEAIRKQFHIPSKIQFKTATGTYSLETTNNRALQRIHTFGCDHGFRGMKSLEFKLWSRALYYQSSYRRRSAEVLDMTHKLSQIQSILRKLKCRHKAE